MKFAYRYYGHTQVSDSPQQTQMQFAPDTLRQPVHFSGQLNPHAALAFREAISAMHDVVIADLRTQKKDRSAYFSWLAENESLLLNEYMAQASELRQQIPPLKAELERLRNLKQTLLQPFYKARQKYFDYLYQTNRDMWLVLDPVISVHPDKILFECFSRDESSYASLSCRHNIFTTQDEFACGTTNIDYSADLYQEFQKIRSYKTTRFDLMAAGFQVQTASDDAYHEAKIDLPDSWIRGFLQVSSALALPATRLTLHPMDIHNLCQILRRHLEQQGPRSLRFILQPGQPIKMRFEPWNIELNCPRSLYQGETTQEIRLWGRRRLLTLERLIAHSQRFSVILLGTGLPSYWIAHLPELDYTLGLSGWTANDWSRAGNFDLLAVREEISSSAMQAIISYLNQHWLASAAQLATVCNLSAAEIASGLSSLMQSGRVVFDAVDQLYRWRDLVREPLDMAGLRFASAQEAEAAALLNEKFWRHLQYQELPEQVQQWRAEISESPAKMQRRYRVMIQLDADQGLHQAECECAFYVRNRLYRGPCPHMLALRQIGRKQQSKAA